MKHFSSLVSLLAVYSLAAFTVAATPAQAQSLDWSNLTIRNSAGDSLKLSGFASAGLWFQNNSGFGSSKANFDGRTDVFNESGGLLALDGNYGLGSGQAYGTLYGGLAGTFSQNGINHEISNPGGPYNPPRTDAAVERYFAGWRSADLFPGLGKDAIDLSLGKQSYHIGRAFLFWGGSSDCGERIASLPLYAVLGLVCGLLGVAYNRTILATLNVFEYFDRWPRGLKGALVGAGVGLLAWFLPHLVGGGDNLAQTILSGFALGPLSYAAGTPGGLFAPLLVVGAQLGFLGGTLGHTLTPTLVTEATPFAVAGMAAFFTATVSSPFTGILLVVEMTDSFHLLLAMLAAASVAYAVPTMLRNQPIYDALGDRQVAAQNKQSFKEGSSQLPRKGRR